MGEVIAVVSGKGGTGKTSLCAGVATALAARGAKVLCIDCDVGLRNLDISLGLTENAALSFRDLSEGGYPLSRAMTHPQFPTLSFLTAPMNCPAESLDLQAFLHLLRQARREYAYIFLDAPAGMDAGFRLAATDADRCILVTNSDPASIRDAARTAQTLELMGRRQIKLVVNRIRPKMISAMALTVDDVMDQSGLPLLGIVPEDEHVTFAAAFGKPLSTYVKKSPAAAAFDRIAQRIQGIPVRIPIRKFK